MSSPELTFRIEAARAEPAATPSIGFSLVVRSAGEPALHSLLLSAQVRIAVYRRPQDLAANERLRFLFGDPATWREGARSLLWDRLVCLVPSFEGEGRGELRLPCSYDFEVGWASYLDAVRDGVIPLDFLFSGTAFFRQADGRLSATLLPWDREARFDLPVRVVRDALEGCFPGSAWIRIGRDTFDRLTAFRARQAIPTWDGTLEALLPAETASQTKVS